MTRPSRDADVVIAGGGLAGSAAAIRLAEAGLRVILVEKTRGAHDKVCGEFLSGEAIAMLAGLGIDLAALGAVPIRQLGVPRRDGILGLPLPFPAASLSRRVLDEAMLDLAARRGAMVRRGIGVRGFATEPGGVVVRLDGGGTLAAADLLVATGKHDLAGHGRPPGPQGGLLGLKMHYAAPPGTRLAARTDLLTLPGGYAGLQPVGNGRFNLCLLAPRETVAAGGGFAALVAALAERNPAVADLLTASTPLFEKPVAVARIPYGFVRGGGGAVRFLGDQAAVIPSFTGDGMSIALWTGLTAAAGLLAGETPAAYQARVARTLRSQVRRASLLSALLVRPWFQRVAVTAVSLAPALADAVARATRLPADAVPPLRPEGA